MDEVNATTPDLPPRPIAEEAASETRLSWLIVPLAFGAVLLVTAGFVLAAYLPLRGRSPQIVGGLWSNGMLPKLISGGWWGLKIGLGAALGEHCLPRNWPRAIRWSLGIGVLSLVPRPDVTFRNLDMMHIGGASLSRWLFGHPARMLLLLRMPAACVLAGAALGWAAESVRGRTWRVVGASVVSWTLVGLAHLAMWDVYVRYGQEDLAGNARPPNCWSRQSWSLCSSVLIGVFLGLAFAAALKIGERRRPQNQ